MELKALVRSYIKENEVIECERLATENGHELLLTPPYHSDLQPIKLVWALIKGAVGRQYDNDTTLDAVYNRLMEQFNNLQTNGHKKIEGLIEKCAKISLKFYEEMDNDNNDDSDDDSDDGSDAIDNEDEEVVVEEIDDTDGDTTAVDAEEVTVDGGWSTTNMAEV